MLGLMDAASDSCSADVKAAVETGRGSAPSDARKISAVGRSGGEGSVFWRE